MTEAVILMCPGARSPFGDRTFQRCIDECARFEYAAEGMAPAMRWCKEADGRRCPNMLPKGGA